MKKLSFIISGLAVLLASCSNVAEDDRFTYVKPAQVNRPVLIEDFTGQKCINCPQATMEIESLRTQYGADKVIAVGIHSGPLGFKGNAKSVGLATDLGDTYYSYWGAEYQPVGMINRSALSNYTDWAAQVRTALEQTAPLSLNGAVGYDKATRQVSIDITASGLDGSTTGKLQLWVVEDSITALQLMPDGSANTNYLHNHVLRAAVNGVWGDDITVNEDVPIVKHYQCSLETVWVPVHCSIIAFVYNANGVIYVIRKPITN